MPNRWTSLLVPHKRILVDTYRALYNARASARMNIQEITKLLDEKRAALGASSCTLYVPDPYWTDEYRLVCMPGVKIQEPMYGFISPEQSKRIIYDDRTAIFCPPDELVLAPEEKSTILETIPEDKRILFADFRERERIKSCARLSAAPFSGEAPQVRPTALLFVNYNKLVDFDQSTRSSIHALFDRVLEAVPSLVPELRELDAAPTAEAMRILRPVQGLAKSPENPDLSGHFAEILRLSLEALGIQEDEGFGTIHLYDSSTDIVRLAGHYGNALDLGRAQLQSVSRGQGVISWVVLRERAILINDLPKSRYRGIHISLDDRVRSELAVPMIASGELVGVLNLECRRRDAFRPESVRSLWYAANRAAVAYQISKLKETTRTMLEICSYASRDNQGTRASLDKIATALKEVLKATFCDIWHYNTRLMKFDAAGASYEAFERGTPVRSPGWSTYIRSKKIAVWISDIKDTSACRVSTWNDDYSAAKDLEDVDAPSSLNDRVVELEVKCELGIPVIVAGTCVGVAWVKYTRNRAAPSAAVMKDVVSLANQAGFVLEAALRQGEVADHDALLRIGEQLQNRRSPSGPVDFGKLLTLEGYVVQHSVHPDVCGDFHATRTVNDSTVGVFIGDGEGHGVTGLINALPLITSFEAFSGDSGSSLYLMDKLMSISNELGVRGVGLYLTFTAIEKDLWLSATCAGNAFAVLVRTHPEYKTQRLPPTKHPAQGPGLGLQLEIPLAEFQEKLEKGDILIAYTDGLSDGLAETGSLAEAALPPLALASSLDSCEQIANAIMAAAEKGMALRGKRGETTDDMTVCVIRVKN